MNKGRMEAFSDGVLAIIITIMVLEIKVPHHAGNFTDLLGLLPVFLSYVLSFVYIGIYWNNHHHMMHSVSKVTGGILWANLHLLFWLSLVPFCTGWMGENHFTVASMVLYGTVLLMAGIAYWLLQNCIIATQGAHSVLKKAVGRDFKGKSSPVFYLIGIALSFYSPWMGGALYVWVALMWLIPDKRMESIVANAEEHEP